MKMIQWNAMPFMPAFFESHKIEWDNILDAVPEECCDYDLYSCGSRFFITEKNRDVALSCETLASVKKGIASL